MEFETAPAPTIRALEDGMGIPQNSPQLPVGENRLSGKLLAGRIELDAPAVAVARLSANRFAIASEIELGGENSSAASLKMNDLMAGRLVIRHALIILVAAGFG